MTASQFRRSVAFLLIGLSMIVTLHFALLSGLRKTRTGDFGVWNAIVTGAAPADLLIIGSSRALVHFDCPRITRQTEMRCWNIGLNGSPPNLELPLAKVYFERHPAPRLVVISLDITSLQVRRDPYNPIQYLPYLSEPSLYDALVALDRDFIKYRYVPLYGFAIGGPEITRSALSVLFGRQPPESRFNGYAPSDTTWDGTFEEFARTYPDGKTFPIEEEAIRSLSEIATLASQAGSSLIFAYPPELAEGRRFERNREDVLAVFRRLAKQYNAPFFDYSDDPITGDRSMFYNSQHLNRVGAERFTDSFVDDLTAYRRSNHID